MDFLEKDLEQIIMKTDVDKLAERGLSMSRCRKNQVRIGNYGVADIITVDRNPWDEILEFTIYELKKDKIGVSTLAQICQYARGIQRYLEKHKPNICYTIKLVMIGREMDMNSSFAYLSRLFEDVYTYTYYYDIDGLRFKNEVDYSLIEEGF